MRLNILLTLLLLWAGSPAVAVQGGQVAPDCPSIFINDTEQIKLSDFRGKVLLIDFWATWCPPCLKSMPFFNSLHNQLQPQGLEIVAINVDEDTQLARQFLKKYPVDYKMGFDPEGNCPSIYNVKAMPSSYLIDKAGKIYHIHLGYRDGDQEEIRQKITALLAE